ncbi:ARMT1 [Lepeophtheirus salmonis]|uniref:Sugar phosphate phosphatase n=1 Tax=Lepeophtheirus salmonis TaxID=72036 RepID=A0A7R8D1J5_LEPSM|nr:ARMT1 [Lepeophtheirus salmonis]CAF2996352.1 ARMT1 [Lepeophtheirus salmonis]
MGIAKLANNRRFLLLRNDVIIPLHMIHLLPLTISKNVIERLSGLRYELTTNKPLKPFVDKAPDVEIWNNYLTEEKNNSTTDVNWFGTRWLYAETYAYRRIFEAFQLTPPFAKYDYFKHLKCQQLESSLPSMEVFSNIFKIDLKQKSPHSVKDLFSVFIMLSLWGNQCDLSLSSGAVNETALDYDSLVSQQKTQLLINDLPKVWEYVNSNSEETIDIVLDNSGFEWFTDLYLADFLISNALAKHIRFHVKAIPWFVSDVTSNGFDWMFEFMSHHESLIDLVTKWESYLENVIFKGDLNYRKCVGDRNWDPTYSFVDAIQGLQSLSVLCLRTLKADTVDKNWMINGNSPKAQGL